MKKDFLKYIVNTKATIRDVAEKINSFKTAFAIIVDEENHIIGTVTDGDIRRAFLANKNLDTPVDDIMCKKPLTASSTTSQDEMINILRRQRLQHLPVLDSDGRIEDVFYLDYQCDNKLAGFNKAVIMAGGEGLRLRPITEKIPKPMIEVGGKPVLEHIINGLVSEGITNIYLSVNYKAEIIESYFKDGSGFGAKIEYLYENRKLGTAGSLSLLPAIPDETILVINGDVLTTVNYKNLFAFHIKHRGVMTVSSIEYKVHVPYGSLEIANQFIVRIEEKPVYNFCCNAGVYAIDPEVFHFVPKDTYYDITSLMKELIENGLPISVFPIHEYWMDVGKPEDLEKAKTDNNILNLK